MSTGRIDRPDPRHSVSMQDMQGLREAVDNATTGIITRQEDMNAADAALDPLPGQVNSNEPVGAAAQSLSALDYRYVPRHDPRQRPQGLSAQELDAALDRLERLAWTLDTKWQLKLGMGTVRIGYDTIVGLIPVVGDVITTGYAAWIVLKAARMGMPEVKQRRLWFRVAKDALFGSVPVLGTAVDVWYKANERNIDDILCHFGRPSLSAQRTERQRREELGKEAPGHAGGTTAAQPMQPHPQERSPGYDLLSISGWRSVTQALLKQ